MTNFVRDLIDLAGHMGHWGYLVVFAVIMLECQAGLGLFVPGETLVLTAGFLAAQHVFDLDALIVTVALAAITGDSVGYEFGRRLGREWLEQHGRRFGVTKRRLEKADAFVRRHGGKGAFTSHFSHLLRPLMPFLAGSQHMRYPRFFVFNAAGCVLWAAFVSLLGYFFGGHWKLLEHWIGRADLVFGATAVLIVGLMWLWHWIATNEQELRATWNAFLERPRIARFRRRYARQIEFLQNRITPGGYLGLHLTIGVIVIVLASWWFGGVVQDLLAGDPLVGVDQLVATWFHQRATPGLVHVVEGITFFGSGWFLAPASIAVALFLVWRRWWHHLLAFGLTMICGNLLDQLLKALFARPRPMFEHPIAIAHGFSFPSGHTMGATLFYGFIAVVLARTVCAWRWRVLFLITAAFVILLIAFSRVYLGLHYLSDIMGAISAGLVWLAFSLTAVETLRRHARQTRSRSESEPL